MMQQELPTSAKVVIVGGGVIGLSIAYHLADAGCDDVVLLERNTLTSGTSWHAAGIVGPLRATMNLTKLAIYATELFVDLERITGQATGYKRTGGYWFARTEDRLTELKRIKAMGDMTGLDARIVSADDIRRDLSICQTDDLAGALWVTEDGQVNPVDLCMAYAKGARAKGVRIFEGIGVDAIETHKGAVRAVTLEDGGRIQCEKAVNCAGVWARDLGAKSDVDVPVQAVEHIYVVTEPIDDLPDPFPILRDLDGGTYIKEDAGKLVIGGFEHNAKPWRPSSNDPKQSFLIFPEDWDQAEPFLTCAIERMPLLERVGLQHFMNGPEGFTPDTKQAMGEAPDVKNYFVAAGFNSIGIVSSAGAGRAMAEWIIDGEPPMELWEVDIQRYHPGDADIAFLEARVVESVESQFDMHWPYKQAKTGRGRRTSPLHDVFKKAGAVFGAPTGWERPLWFAKTDAEKHLSYSYGDQAWWPVAEREAKHLQEHTTLFDLSPFTKIDVSGPDALGLLQYLCAGEINVDVGRAVYTQMLNARGGIEADLTVTRRGEASFRVTSGAATWVKDLAWLRKHAEQQNADVTITDQTRDEAVIGVMGPKARDLLSAVSDADFSNDAFSFSSAELIRIADAHVWATRMSFVGELGWELSIANTDAEAVHDALSQAGSAFDLGYAGHWCLDTCRMEKAFRHWGHDIGPDDTPLHAGLGFAVAWHKDMEFLGKAALLEQRRQGVDRHLMLFAVDGAHPLVLHDEPIFCDGVHVGRTTSGNRGFRVGKTLCMGYIACERGTKKSDLLAGHYEIEIAGVRFTLEALARPPYDPTGERMR